LQLKGIYKVGGAIRFCVIEIRILNFLALKNIPITVKIGQMVPKITIKHPIFFGMAKIGQS